MSNNSAIDLRIGESRIIRSITSELFDLANIGITMNSVDWEYHPHGYEPLVRTLEEKHAARVIITNGANQALHAAMYALKQKGFANMGIRIPYWNRIPEIAKHIGIGCTPFVGSFLPAESTESKIDSYFLTMPNNPDGHIPSRGTVQQGLSFLKERDIPIIHDAVYYNRSYLPIDYPVEPIGDVQIFSASKTYGLSSLRLGYIVVYNASFYRLLTEYMEFSTVGASIPSQKILLHILNRKLQLPFLEEKFEKLTRETVQKARNIVKNVNPDYIGLPENFNKTSGIFAWVKPKLPNIFEKANIQVLDGSIFGAPGFVRINLAVGHEILGEAVKRINNV